MWEDKETFGHILTYKMELELGSIPTGAPRPSGLNTKASSVTPFLLSISKEGAALFLRTQTQHQKKGRDLHRGEKDIVFLC